MAKLPYTINIYLKKMKGRKRKRVLFTSGYQWEGRRINEEGERGQNECDGCTLYISMKIKP
jgi:hypothetical protein